MPTGFAGTPVDYAEITIPAGSDKPSGALLSTPLEQLRNQSLFDREDLDSAQTDLDALEAIVALERPARACQADVLGTAIANDGYLEINNLEPLTQGYTIFTIGGGGHELQFPSFSNNDDRGIYEVTVSLTVLVDSTADPTLGQVVAELWDASEDPGDEDTLLAQMKGRRFSANAGHAFEINDSFLVDMTGLAPGLSRLRLYNLSGFDLTVSAGRIHIHRTGRGSP